jgi:hypothetical protein
VVWITLTGIQIALSAASAYTFQGTAVPISKPIVVSAILRSGTTMADAEHLAAATEAAFERAPSGSAFQLNADGRSIGFMFGTYACVGASGVEVLDVAPFRAGGRLYVPLRLTVERLGGKLVGSGSNLAVQAASGNVVPVRIVTEAPLPADPFERLLVRLENAPIQISESAKGALIGEAQLEVLDASLELIRPSLPALKALGDSKIIELIGHIPGIGTPVKIVQDVFGASGEIVSILEWYSSVDKKLSQPMRKGILACDKLLKSRSRSDLDGTIAGLDSIGAAAKEYQAMGVKAATAILKYKASVGRFQQAVKRLAEAYGTTVPDPTSASEQPGSPNLTSQIQKLFTAFMKQANDLASFARDASADAKAAKRGGGQGDRA